MLSNLISSTVLPQPDSAASFAASSKSISGDESSVSAASTSVGQGDDTVNNPSNEFEQHLESIIERINGRTVSAGHDLSQPSQVLTEQEVEQVIEQFISAISKSENANSDSAFSMEAAMDVPLLSSIINALPPEQRDRLVEQLNALSNGNSLAARSSQEAGNNDQSNMIISPSADSEAEQQVATAAKLDNDLITISPILQGDTNAKVDDDVINISPIREGGTNAKTVDDVITVTPVREGESHAKVDDDVITISPIREGDANAKTVDDVINISPIREGDANAKTVDDVITVTPIREGDANAKTVDDIITVTPIREGDANAKVDDDVININPIREGGPNAKIDDDVININPIREGGPNAQIDDEVINISPIREGGPNAQIDDDVINISPIREGGPNAQIDDDVINISPIREGEPNAKTVDDVINISPIRQTAITDQVPDGKIGQQQVESVAKVSEFGRNPQNLVSAVNDDSKVAGAIESIEQDIDSAKALKSDSLVTAPKASTLNAQEIAALKADLRAVISTIEPEKQQQIKQQLSSQSQPTQQTTAQQTPTQLIDQISRSQRKVLEENGGKSIVENKASSVTSAINVPNQPSRSASNSAKAEEFFGTKIDADVESDDVELDLKLTPQSSLIANQNSTNSFEAMIKQIDSQSRSLSNQVNDSISAAQAANAKMDQQESSAINQANTAQVKTVQEQLEQKMPLHQQFAASALKERMSLMLNGGVSQAVIQLDPEELGAMSIRLVMQNDQVNVQFQVQNPAAKDMLEQAMGKLKEMLDEQGIALGQSDVEQQSQGGDSQQQEGDPASGNVDEFDSEITPETMVLHKQSADGIDYYA